jgi:predicted NBD/HSP70 family sugar kinase
MLLGIDLGGTKIEGVVLDESGDELVRRRVRSPQGDYGAIVRAVARLVAELESEAGERCPVGVGTPGTVSPATGLMKNSNTVALNGKPLHRDLVASVGRPVRMANDANCLALSEATDGAGAGDGIVFAVIVGTGCGAGIAIDGKVRSGRNAVRGEWGHNPLPWPRSGELPGPRCYCGLSGCIETWLSGPGMSADHERRTGEKLTAKEIVSRAERGSATGSARGLTGAEESVWLYEDRMARCLATVINVVDPDTIVLGGGLSNISSLYANVPSRWGRYVFSDRVDTRLVSAAHGDSSGVRGAAWLCLEG